MMEGEKIYRRYFEGNYLYVKEATYISIGGDDDTKS